MSRREFDWLGMDRRNVAHGLVQCPLDGCDEIFGLERLHHIAIRALLLSPELVALLPLGGAQHDRNSFETVIVLQVTAGLKPIPAWHHDIQDDQIGLWACWP